LRWSGHYVHGSEHLKLSPYPSGWVIRSAIGLVSLTWMSQ
jgi:hypothetical protein